MYQQPRTAPDGAPIPENYSGNAFRYPPIGSLGTPPNEPEMAAVEEIDGHEEQAPLLPAVTVPREERAHDVGGGGWLFRGLGNEEWLLLGLCLLLMGDNGPRMGGEKPRNDLLPYLLLLLFCG